MQLTSNEGMSNDAPIHECECDSTYHSGKKYLDMCSYYKVCSGTLLIDVLLH